MDITFALALFAAINAIFTDAAVIIGIICWFYNSWRKGTEFDKMFDKD